ncbi:hypothetical protein [Bacillus sp. RO1]|uniref:hypothetical protein n=1 Tax=Bacillus sp. RO1 TaxID=2722703 RepID=UPI001456C708|nr:hypothetical protein [Bacillus sp. RO1]NLP50211.1 hypothetical protein [Bacillus sp. RO1]
MTHAHSLVYETMEEAADEILALISKFVDVNTFFIAKNDKKDVNIIHAFNRNDVVLPSGFETLYRDSY